MNKAPKTRIRVPRASLSTRIGSLDLGKAKAYADFLRDGDPDGPIPCWGAITKRFVESFSTDEDRLAVLEQLIEEGDRRPLLLFIDTSRQRPELLAAMCERAGELPLTVQRALVATPEAEVFVENTIEKFQPAARRVWDGGEETKRAERQLLESRVGELMSFQYFVPDTFDPRDEPTPKRELADTPSDGGSQ